MKGKAFAMLRRGVATPSTPLAARMEQAHSQRRISFAMLALTLPCALLSGAFQTLWCCTRIFKDANCCSCGTEGLQVHEAICTAHAGSRRPPLRGGQLSHYDIDDDASTKA